MITCELIGCKWYKGCVATNFETRCTNPRKSIADKLTGALEEIVNLELCGDSGILGDIARESLDQFKGE